MSEQEQPRRQTRCLEKGQVMAWHDGVLSPGEANEVMAHLATCVRCAALEQSLLSDRRLVLALLSGIDPRPGVTPQPAAALAHFRERLALMNAGTQRSANPPHDDDGHHPARPSLTRSAEAERGMLLPIALHAAPHRRPWVWFQTLVAAVIIAVLLGSVLLVRTWLPSTGNHRSPGSLNLSTSQVNFGLDTSAPQRVQVRISNFASNAQVLLTRDIQEAVQIMPKAQDPALVKVGANGSAAATIIVTPDWGFGPHTIYAVDIKSQFTASTGLLVIGATQSQPAHLEVTSSLSPSTPLTTLDLGSSIQGSNTTQAIYLKNTSQSGSITWSASSNQSWLLISPSSGMFNQSQTIEVAVQRGNLPPGGYAGVIKFYSNVGPVQSVNVTMTVTSAPSDTSVAALSPAALSFVTTDGSFAPCQVLTISNPGSRPLNWSLTTTSSTTESTQIAIARALGTSGSWLTTSLSNGSIPVSSYQLVSVCAQSAGLLPGAYLGSLQITAPGAADNPQTVSVSLTVQPHCGLTTSASFLNFTAVQGKTSAGWQGLGLNETASCAGAPVNWTSQVSTPAWLSVTLASGQLKGATSEFLAVNVNATGLAPQKQPYTGFLVFSTQNSTQTVLVQLIVQQPPSASEPVMGVSPLNLNFSSTEGQPGTNGQVQVVTVTNNGGGTLYWKATPTPFSNVWLSVSPTGGNVPEGQTGAATIMVDTSHLTPGTYAGQVTLNGYNSISEVNPPASGSPQVIQVNLVVQPPCTLTQPSLSSLAFTGVQGGSNPVLQNVLITGIGNCTWPLLVTASVPSSVNWLLPISPASIKGNGQSTSLSIGPGSGYTSLKAGTYTAQITITATYSAGIVAQGSGQVISVTLTVQPPCTFASPVPSSLIFTIAQGAAQGTAQNVALSETGACAFLVSYTATPSASATWLSLTPPPPDTGIGSSLAVNVSTTGLAIGQLTGQITVTAVDKNGVAVLGPLTIPVTLNVVAPTVSGTVFACSGPAPTCPTPPALPNASITVLDSTGTTTILTTTADASGNFVVNLPPGTYTVNISGTDSSNTHYSTTGIPLVVTGNATGVLFDVFPG